MQKITALKLQKRNRQRVNVYLDGEFSFGLAHIVAAWLRVGQELSDEKIAQLKTDDTREEAYQRALNFISYRPRSETEVRTNLQKHNINAEIIEATLVRLRKNNIVNDLEFTQLWIENRNEFRPRGQRALRAELRQKGIPEDMIEEALTSLDEETLAYKAAQKKAPKLSHLDFFEFKRKLYGFLGRKGFQYDTIASVTQKVWDEYKHETN